MPRRLLVTLSCKALSTSVMVSFTDPAGTAGATSSRREITTLESSFGGLNRSPSRCRKRRRERGTAVVSCLTMRRNGVVSATIPCWGPIRSRMFLSSSLAVEPARIVRRRLIVRRSLSASSRVMLSRRIVCNESRSPVSERSESMQALTVRSSRL